MGLFGMGGIGKTTLSVELAQQIKDHFDYVVWKSLRNNPPIQEVLINLIEFLSDGQQAQTNLPTNVDDKVTCLIEYLRKHRCLIVLDNADALLVKGIRAGYYRDDASGYGVLLQRLGECPHRSCLLVTSREKPRGIAALEGKNSPVRSLQLAGIKSKDAQVLFQGRNSFVGSPDDWEGLIQHYAGNPLALKIAVTAIENFFDGSISEFLKFQQQDTLVFDDIRDLLKGQFDNLSSQEQEVMYWLAIHQEPVTLAQLQEDILLPETKRLLVNVLSSLNGRSLIENTDNGFTLQPVVMEYVIERLVEQLSQEISGDTSKLLLTSYALLLAQSRDYVRNAQARTILKPVADQLLTTFKDKKQIVTRLIQITAQLQYKSALETGYAGGNILNLMNQLQVDLSGYDFSHLTIWQADLQNVDLRFG